MKHSGGTLLLILAVAGGCPGSPSTSRQADVAATAADAGVDGDQQRAIAALEASGVVIKPFADEETGVGALLVRLDEPHVEQGRIRNVVLAQLPSLPEFMLEVRRTKLRDEALADLAPLPNLLGLDVTAHGITGAGLRDVGEMTELVLLDLTANRCHGLSLRHLTRLQKLRFLSLNDTPVGDQGLEPLGQLTSLRRLQLARTKVTDQGLANLGGLQHLRVIDLRGTSVSRRAAERLKTQLPECRILFED